MALSHLLKYLYNNGTDDAIRRGKKILARQHVELLEHDEFMAAIGYRVKDDNYNIYYKVKISRYADEKLLALHCTCPDDDENLCRHKAAALLRLQEMVDKNLLVSTAIQHNQLHTVAKIKQIDIKALRMLSSQMIYQEAEDILNKTEPEITLAQNERVEATLILNNEKFPLVIQKNEERNFDTSCTCSETLHPLCKHKIVLFLYLYNNYGANYFDSIRNWEKEQNKLLGIYGYSLKDDLTNKFEFIYKDGKPYLKLLDSSIKRVAAPAAAVAEQAATNTPTQKLAAFKTSRPAANPAVQTLELPALRLGVVFNFNEKKYPFFTVQAVSGEANDEGSGYLNGFTILDLEKFVELTPYSAEDQQLFAQIRKLQGTELNKFLSRNSPFTSNWENIVQQDSDQLPTETRQLMAEYLQPKLAKLFASQHDNHFVYALPAGKELVAKNLKAVFCSDKTLKPALNVEASAKGYEIECYAALQNKSLALADNSSPSSFLFLKDENIYTWSSPADIDFAEQFTAPNHTIIPKNKWESYLQDTIMPATKNYVVDFDSSIIKKVPATIPQIKLRLSEKGEYLLFQPVYTYEGFETRADSHAAIMIPAGDKVLVIKRNEEVEKSFLRSVQNLHSSFVVQEDSGNLILKGAEVLKNNWFFLFVDAMHEMKVPVFGFEALRNFNFNTAKPTTHIHVSSGLDWFDANIEVRFGENKVGISEIKKALASRQSFVQLSDGSMGILPDEWLKKYSLLFKVGDGRSTGLRLSKYHTSVIDELYENRNEEELSFALDEKYERLRDFKSIPPVPAPANVEPILRPYQLSGFHWLHYLSTVGWGGILADDMGLGKTLQALSILQKYKEEQGEILALVVCPTTLIYNWQNEVSKFTPGLSYLIHHGSMRTRQAADLQQKDVIITTYGTLRSDIQMLLKLKFDFAILDESQAIKNPTSKVTKAATLLNAKNKLCMSGTPLQNNTFDIYAQMNFLNPGLLGSVEYFRNEFATPIDKFGELEQKQHLRRLLMPFILRRTKEQVAKDLPEKTETILFCEMETEQRKIYDAYRNTYRNKILGAIDEQGIDKSQLTILQGLMKLRQICDSPAILNEEEKFPNHSIKLEELTREITENIGEHKALVFSQFLGMLGLIKEKLKAENIPFEYFDGSTSSPDRQKAIENFQNNDSCRVFLISLKAGGVGLNLTAADYVYIVDPWWNPAVEQQAIDRTHRIGQTKNIFAYRMICVDTIEDKILQLHEKKKSLAKDLISDESGFIKSLSKEDVEYLFS